MTRWKAAAIHLAISAVVVGSVVVLVLLTLYPPAYVRMGKLTQLMGLIGGIDLVLGPLLTLIVFRTGKPKLKLDLAIIGLLQLSAMAYGLHVLWQSRPVFLVAVPDRFELVYANEIDPADLAAGMRPEFRELSRTGPRLVGAQLPLLGADTFELSLMASQGRDVQVLPKYYVPFEDASVALAGSGLPLAAGPGTLPAVSEALLRSATRLEREPATLVWVPISSRRGAAAAMLLDARTGAVVAPVDIDPWSGQGW